jgi:hypothetical protein
MTGYIEPKRRREAVAVQPAGMNDRDTARYPGVSGSKVWSLIEPGELPSVRLGGRTVVRVVDADALLFRLREVRAA